MTARRSWDLLPILVLAVGLAAAPAWAQPYRLVNLTALGIQDFCCINNAGQVADVSGGSVLIYSNGLVTTIGTISLTDPGLSAVNGSEALAGYFYTGDYYTLAGSQIEITHAFLYANGLATDLGTLPGVGGSSTANGINASGEVTGTNISLPNPNMDNIQVSHAFLYSGGLMADIGTLPAGTGAAAAAINTSGQIAGAAYGLDVHGNPFNHAFRYTGGVMQDLGTLGGTNSTATAINDNGLVTGHADMANDWSDAFISDGLTMTDLGNLGAQSQYGNVASYGTAINASGVVVGVAYIPVTAQGGGIGHAFLYSGGQMVDLNSLIDLNDPLSPYVTLLGAYAINDAGMIITEGMDSRGTASAIYLLVDAGTAVPPSLSANATTVTVGTPVILTWSGTAGATCTATGGSASDGWTGSLPLSGSQSVTESAVGQYTYGVACMGSGGTAQAQVTVTVVLPMVTLSANASAVFTGIPVLLLWQASSGTSCTATGGNSGDGWTGNLAVSGSKSVTESAAGKYTYGITCTGAGQTAQAQVTVSVAVPAVTLTASATTVLMGTPLTLTWNATTGSACTATGGSSGDGWTGSLGATGSRVVTESASGKYTYGVTCTGGSQTAQAQVVVTVGVLTVSLSATPTTSTVGQAVILTWSSTFAAGCIASGGANGDGWTGTKATSGMASVMENAAATYTYTLVCSAGGQLVQAQAVVTVNSAPSSGGGAFDGWSLLALSSIFGLRGVARRRAIQLRR